MSSRYCTLEENTLNEMVAAHWFGEEKKAMCLERLKNAGFAPLAVSVNIGPDTVHYVSVLEQKPSYYSHVGKVMVAYNSKKNRWHCPCAKPQASCKHKNIAKWFLFQNKRHLFKSVKSTEPVVNTTSNYLEEGEVSQDRYPPGKELLRTATYIQKFKKLPATLPKDVLTPSFEHHPPKEFVPSEMFCTECSGQRVLNDPILIAKLLTLTHAYEGKRKIHKG